MHVEQVLGDVPRAGRCACNEKPQAKPTTSAAPPPKSIWDKLMR